MWRFCLFWSLVILVGLFVSCGDDDDDENSSNNNDDVADVSQLTTILLEDIVGTFELTTLFDKATNTTTTVGTEVAGDLRNIRIIGADNTYTLTKTETEVTYTESGTYELINNLITFEIGLSLDDGENVAENIGVKNSFAVETEPGTLILTMRDSTGESFKADIGDVLTYTRR